MNVKDDMNSWSQEIELGPLSCLSSTKCLRSLIFKREGVSQLVNAAVERGYDPRRKSYADAIVIDI